jgi:uncharacterized protein (DUF849 family)
MIIPMLQVCLNGSRDRSSCAGLPVTPPELGDAAAQAVAAGARDIHLHPRDDRGADTMDPLFVDAAVAAVRAAAPGVTLGVTTGAWTEPDPVRRAALVRSWSVLPDHASVNFHEAGAEGVAEALLACRIGVEAGIFAGTDGAARLRVWSHAHRVRRILAEVEDPDPVTGPAAAVRLLAELAGPDGSGGAARRPVLLHGVDGSAWPILRLAADRALDTRIGLEDVLLLPDGTPAPGNAALVLAARQVLGQAVRG